MQLILATQAPHENVPILASDQSCSHQAFEGQYEGPMPGQNLHLSCILRFLSGASPGPLKAPQPPGEAFDGTTEDDPEANVAVATTVESDRYDASIVPQGTNRFRMLPGFR